MNLMYKPLQIKIAIKLIIFSFLLGIIKSAFDYEFLTSLLPIRQTLITMVFTVLTMLFFTYKIWEGKNWARLVFTVFVILGLYPSHVLMSAEINRSVLIFVLSLLQAASQIIAIVLLYLPMSNKWFKSNKVVKNA